MTITMVDVCVYKKCSACYINGCCAFTSAHEIFFMTTWYCCYCCWLYQLRNIAWYHDTPSKTHYLSTNVYEGIKDAETWKIQSQKMGIFLSFFLLTQQIVYYVEIFCTMEKWMMVKAWKFQAPLFEAMSTLKRISWQKIFIAWPFSTQNED